MKTKDQTRAAKIINRIKESLANGTYSRDGITWTLADGRLDQCDDATGNWHTVGQMSLMHATAYIARTVAGRLTDSTGEDSLEGDVIDVLHADHNWMA